MTYYVNIQAGKPVGFIPDAAKALETVSVPVEVLFNENDTCGEVVPMADAAVKFLDRDGKEREFRFEKHENVILGHEDISPAPIA